MWDHADSGFAMSTRARVYLDFNATAPLVPAARDAMIEAMTEAGNPSSIHAEGRRMRDRVERARNQVAHLVGRPREQVVFTSGGTEANWLGVMALAAAAEARGLPRVISTTSIEHPSLRGAVAALLARGWTLGDEGAGLTAMALVNHELGTVATIQRRGLVHVDAVQAAGKLDLVALDADSLAISAHKLGGPQGVGALAIANDDALPVHAFDSGHQERGRRPGPENTLGIIGFGAAAAAVDRAAWARAQQLGRWLEGALRDLGARIHGDDRERLGSTINAAWSGARGESIVMALDLEGISVSTGAACTSGSIQPSAVLLGLGLSEEQAREGVRFSLGPTTTEDELKRVLEALPRILERARRHR
jgi:cysteine desulfurase